MPIEIKEHIKILNNLSQNLKQDIDDVRNGKLDLKKAGTINRLSSTAIRACVQGVLLANHQEIQRHKINMQSKEQAVKLENIELQRERIKERQARV